MALALVLSAVVVRAGGLSGVVRAGFVGFVVTGLRLDVTGFVQDGPLKAAFAFAVTV